MGGKNWIIIHLKNKNKTHYMAENTIKGQVLYYSRTETEEDSLSAYYYFRYYYFRVICTMIVATSSLWQEHVVLKTIKTSKNQN